MTTRYMRRFFEPKSIAVIGASERSPSLGGTVLGNLLAAGYPGALMAVNPHGGDRILGVPRYASVEALPQPPDLAIVCTNPGTIPKLTDELGKKGVRAVLIVMGGLSMPQRTAGNRLGQAIEFVHDLLGIELDSGKTLKQATWEAAQPHALRLMGPNCIGLVVPHNRLNASYAHCMVPPGDVAYVGQSGVLGLAVMDWAQGRGLGLSYLTTLGDSLDIDIADVLEYLAEDWRSRAIILHVEELTSGRRFVSALRAAARSKLVLVMKSRRVCQSGDRAEPLAPGLRNPDLVYDAVLRRAGVLRVARADEVFNALETLTRLGRLHGERLAIFCNGLGPALIATDHLLLGGGNLAALREETAVALREHLPPFWDGRNPVDIQVNASPELFGRVLEILRADPDVDAVLALHVPTLTGPSLATAEAMIPVARNATKPILTCWMGFGSAQAARAAFDSAGISTFDTPEEAIDAFMHMVRYRRNQDELSQIPQLSGADDPVCDFARVWALVGDALYAGRALLSDEESMRVLEAVGVPVAESRYTSDISGLKQQVSGLAPHYAIKILTDPLAQPFLDTGTKSNPWRGIVLDVGSIEELEEAARSLREDAIRRFPDRPVHGFKVQQMRRGLNSLQLSMGITRDPVFGPLLFFGSGGNPISALADRQVGLPPLNLPLARLLIDSTAAGSELADFSADAEVDRDVLAGMLVRLGELIVDVPVIAALEINPVLVNREGILALEAKIALGDPVETAITPYPSELEETVRLSRSGREVLLRPIRDRDAPAHAAFMARLSPDAIRYRFFQPRSRFTRRELAQATQIDYAREMAFIATASNDSGESETLGVVRLWADPDNVSAEFAIIIDDALRGEGLGRLLLSKLIEYTRRRGILELRGTVLSDNEPMLRLAEKLGFSKRYSREDDAMLITMRLNEPTDDWQRERLGLRC